MKKNKLNKAVQVVFDAYPDIAQKKLMEIRAIVLSLSDEQYVGEITETLKWGDPSYLAVDGSTVRLAWQAKYPDQVSVFFNCNTVLVETFRELYVDTFDFVGNREIRFLISEAIPVSALKSFILMSLRYHKIKHLPLLGA